ncbi:permease component of ribose/xylose/arabinose/galactoside ABC-type transporters [Hoeflea sp. IMCC20628]|uniref:ABC transporter permease n=1 Tax=Hoeflea sp. IMCC20628 TaxID=1620421 RepID=UPI00063BEE48|nr:ABC transporter permease [Hoeflea sp. IMCC20628]AKH99243.1 permease component of ribose/xylose/arabinose/galactoside ABC-type transporters [Hoeflea sp. IMCC20628]
MTVSTNTLPRDDRRMLHLRSLLGRIGFGGTILIVLLILNIWFNPQRFMPSAWGTVIGLAAPLIGAALASSPSILSGRGGLDISIGPLMGFINVIIVVFVMGEAGLTGPVPVIAASVAIGAAFGAFNGFLVTIMRIQPIVATLGTFLILGGLTTTLVPSPSGTIPDWLRTMSGGWSILPLAGIGLIWFGLTRIPYIALLMACGSDDRAAYTAGVNVTLVRFLAYVLGGVFAGFAALSLTALIGSADPNIGANYTLLAISAVALGGISLAGGRGGPLHAVTGAAAIFLLQSLLVYFNVSTFILQMAYGTILVIAVSATQIEQWLFPKGDRS